MNQRKSKGRKQLHKSRKMEMFECGENSPFVSTDSCDTEVGSCYEEFQPYHHSSVSEEEDEREFESWFKDTDCKREKTEDKAISSK